MCDRCELLEMDLDRHRWRRTADEMPVAWQWVLCYASRDEEDGGGITLLGAHWPAIGWCHPEHSGEEITHWMPLPEPPA